MTDLIYKIATRDQWNEAERYGEFRGSPVDLADGYIHFSTITQVIETATRHFHGQNDLILAAIDPAALGAALKWEPSRGGALFPHLYAPLPLSAVHWVKPLARDAQGSFAPGLLD